MSIVIDETFSNCQCPGSCHPNPAETGSGTLTDLIVGGTGIFQGATGAPLSAAGKQSLIKLWGTIVLAS